MSVSENGTRWQRTGLTESERQSLLSVYKRLEEGAKPVVISYLEAKKELNKLRSVLHVATDTAKGILLAIGHTAEAADSMIKAWAPPGANGGKK